jgi:glycosyltransferase involved in cell wall biosynthesis
MNSAYSAVIPAFNAEATIREAIASILAQSLAPAAIFVIDDGSTDNTAIAAAEMGGPVRVIRKENGGPGSATTLGLRQVVTPFVATLDADDIWLPWKMERQLAALAAENDVAGIFALGRLFRDGERPDPDGNGAIRRLWTRTTMVFRTEAARAIGDLVDLPGYLGELVDWLDRSRNLGHRHVMLEDVLAMRRVRVGSLSDTGSSDRTRGYLHAARRAIERRKQKPASGRTVSDGQ